MEKRDSRGRFIKGYKAPKKWIEINRKTHLGNKSSDTTKKKQSISSIKWHKKPDNKKKFLESIKEPSIKRRKWKISKEELSDLYWVQKLSIRQIAKKLNTSYGLVHSLFERENIQRRTSKEGTKLNPAILTDKGRKSISESSKKYNKEAWKNPLLRKKKLINLENARKKITKESLKKIGIKNSFTWLEKNKKEIVNLYKKGDSAEKIGKKFNVCESVIFRLLKVWKIKINPCLKKIRSLEKEESWLNKRNKEIAKGNEGKIISEYTKLKSSKSHKKLWANEEYAKRMFKTFQIKPNKPEKVIIEFIKQNNLLFKYVGDGKLIIDGKCPDFISTNGDKKVIEMHGRAFHDPNFERRFVKNIPYHRTEKGTIEYYKRHQYDCLVIWDDELKKNPIQVLNKIKNF